jgi:hypothetical protein
MSMSDENTSENSPESADAGTDDDVGGGADTDLYGWSLPVEERPKGLADAYFDAENGSVRVGSMLKRTADQQTEILKLKESVKNLEPPKAPEGGYAVTLPDGAADLGLKDDDPLVAAAKGYFDGRGGISQETFDGLIKTVVEALPHDPQAVIDAMEKRAPGKAKAVMDANAQWLSRFSGDAEVAEVGKVLLQIPGGQAFLAAVRATMREQPLAGGGRTETAPKITEEDLKSMMRDPRYRENHDPAFVKKIDDGWRALYPDTADATGRTTT